MITTAFLDTGFYLSIGHPDDLNSVRGDLLLEEIETKKFGILFTSNAIVEELMLLAWVRTKGNETIIQDIESLIWGDQRLAKIIYIDEYILNETQRAFLKYNKDVRSKEEFLSFVDVSSVIICEKYKLEQIFSFDAHFDRFLTRIY